MKNTKSKVVIALCVALLFMATGYAFFITNLEITTTGNITTNWKVNFISISEGNNGGTNATNAITPTYTDTTATMSANLKLPGDYMEYDIVLKNSGNVNAVIEEVNAVATGAPAIIFTISGINEGDKLAGGKQTTIRIRIEYDPTVTSQPKELTKTLTVSIKAVQDMDQSIDQNQTEIDQPLLSQLRYRVLEDNMVYADNVRSTYVNSDTGINFGALGGNENGKGLYYTSTNTQDGGTTYYFRGNVDNNYVKLGKRTGCGYQGEPVFYVENVSDQSGAPFPTQTQCLSTNVCDAGTIFRDAYNIDYRYLTGLDAATCAYLGGTPLNEQATYGNNIDLLWRIVRINEDGSIRLVTDKVVGQSAYSELANSNIYLGYMYGYKWDTLADWSYEEATQNQKDSTIKTYLDNWYLNGSNLTSYSSIMAKDAGYCNDRSKASAPGQWVSWDAAWGYGTYATVYGAGNRLVNYDTYSSKENPQPQFACPNETRDLFTMNASSKGNQVLTNPVGLLTADEVIYSGAVYGLPDKSSSYLNDWFTFWTMSPAAFNDKAAVFLVNSYNQPLVFDISSNSVGVRPVINLKAKVKVAGGNGTFANPYTVKVN